MAKFWCILVGVLVAVQAEDHFPCPVLRGDRLDITNIPGYQINSGGNTFQIGGEVNIMLTSTNGKFGFFIQANKDGTLETTGSWVVTSENSTQCDDTNQNSPDSLYVLEPELHEYSVTWQAPDGDKTGDAVGVEFFVVFIDPDHGHHSQISIRMLPQNEPVEPTEKPVVVPDTNMDEMHESLTEDQLSDEAAKKKAEEIDAENNASEDDWNKQQVKDMRLREEEMHQEEMEYERLLKQEEDDRLARIRAEIRDKEEYDRLLAEKELEKEVEKEIETDKEQLKPGHENEIDMEDTPQKEVTAGGAHVTGGVTCLLLLVLSTLL